MDPRKWNLRWVAAFAAAALVGAVGVVVVLTVMRGGDGQATAQGTTPTLPPTATQDELTPSPLGSAAPATPDATVSNEPTASVIQSFPVLVPPLPEGFLPGPKRACPGGWQRISDTVANYSFCLPPGWAILDPGSSQPSQRTTMRFESAAILSPEGFPYPYAGSYEKGIRDLLRDSDKNIVWMQLFFIPEGDTQPMSCDAKPAAALGGLPSASCQNSFDIPSGTDKAVPDAEGKWQRLFVVVPLPDAKAPPDWAESPYSTPQGGYQFGLGILFEGRKDALAYYGDVISQILSTLEGQP